jgi:tRNA/rRNA methyltransferase
VRASGEEVERFTALLLGVLEMTGYVHDRVESSTVMKTRRLVRRLGLSSHDAEVWMGMLRQIQWKLGQ